MLKVKKHWSYATMKDQALQLDTVPVLNCLKRTKEQPANANIFNRQSAVAAWNYEIQFLNIISYKQTCISDI